MFIRVTHNSSGQSYYHLGQSYRDAGKVRQRTLLSQRMWIGGFALLGPSFVVTVVACHGPEAPRMALPSKSSSSGFNAPSGHPPHFNECVEVANKLNTATDEAARSLDRPCKEHQECSLVNYPHSACGGGAGVLKARAIEVEKRARTNATALEAEFETLRCNQALPIPSCGSWAVARCTEGRCGPRVVDIPEMMRENKNVR